MGTHTEVRAAKALFKKVADDGACWLFVLLNDRWAITRDDVQVASGAGDSSGLGVGVRKYIAMTSSPPVEVPPLPRSSRPIHSTMKTPAKEKPLHLI